MKNWQKTASSMIIAAFCALPATAQDAPTAETVVASVDGTEITRKSDGSTYVVKALDTGLFLNTQDCSGDLSVPAAFTDLDIVPSPTDKTKPTQIFNNAPTVTAIHVKQGEDLIDPSLVQENE